MRINTIPYSVGSLVEYASKVYFIQKISLCQGHGTASYTLLGSELFSSIGHGIAWIDHNDLHFIREPTLSNWQLIQNLGGI